MLLALILMAAAPAPLAVQPRPPMVSPPPMMAYPLAPPLPAPPPSTVAKPSRAIVPMASLFGEDDYPAVALGNNDQGAVDFRLTVTPEGRVGACEILISSGSATLDARTCAVLHRRARFQPARDSLGNAVADTVRQRVMWSIEDATPYTGGWSSLMYWPAANASATCTAWNANGPSSSDCSEIEPLMRRLWGQSIARTFPTTGGVHILIRVEPGEGEVLKSAPAAGETMLTSDASIFSVLPNGRVSGCRTVESQGAPTKPHCSSMSQVLFAAVPNRTEVRPGRSLLVIGVLPPR